MIKRFISLALVAFSFLSFAPVASAQVYGTCPYNPQTGRWICPPNVPAPVGQMIPMQGHPEMFLSGGNQYRCPALVGWGGGLAGMAVGAFIGKRSTLNGHPLTLPGAVAGAMAGNQIACEYVRPNVVASVAPQRHHGGSGFGSHGSYDGYGGGQQQQGRTVRVPSDCDIEGRPDLQNLTGLQEGQCANIAKALRVTVHGGNSSVQQASVQQVKQAYCPVTGPGGVVKNVLNAERRTAYCGELIAALRSGSVSWDTLRVVQE